MGAGRCAGLSVVAVTLCSAFSAAAAAAAPETTRVSRDTTGVQRRYPSFSPSISRDGSLVAYEAVVALRPEGQADDGVFVFDRATRKTEWVSAGPLGTPENGSSGSPSISADGRLVAFASSSTNLVTGDPSSWPDIFVRNRETGALERITDTRFASPSALGGPSISAAGRFVAFTSQGQRPGIGGRYRTDVLVADRATHANELVSVGADGTSYSADASISADGRYVAFSSDAPHVVPHDTNGRTDVFVRDRVARTTARVDVSSGGKQADGGGNSPSISADGRFVAFASAAPHLVPHDTNGRTDVFVRDRATGTTECVSVDTGGRPGDADSAGPSISSGGRFVSFTSHARNLVHGDTNGYDDVFVRDRATDRTTRVSVSSTGAQGNLPSTGVLGSFESAISGRGRFVAFPSLATNFAYLDTNDSNDVFVRGPLGP